MPSMPVLVVAVTAILCVLTLLWTWTRWAMGHGARVLLRGLGVVLLLVGAWLAGLADLAGNGILSLYDWAQRTVLTTTMVVGLALAGAGLLFWLVGTVLRPRTREQARTTRQQRRGGATPAARPAAAQERPVVRPVAADEDDEVNAILNRHGIQ